MEVAHPRSVARASVHRAAVGKRMLVMASFCALYAVSTQWVVSTVGDPYRAALEEQGKVTKQKHAVLSADEEEEGWTLSTSFEDDDGGAEGGWEADEEGAWEGLAAGEGGAGGWEGDGGVRGGGRQGGEEAEGEEGDVTSPSKMTVLDADGVETEVDSELIRKLSERAFDPMFDDLEEFTETFGSRPLPSQMLPNAWAGASLFATVSLHALFFLLQRWFVGFRAATSFERAPRVEAGCVVQLNPQPHRGKAALCELEVGPGGKGLVFTFQRQKYEYVPPGERLDALLRASKRGGEEEEQREDEDDDDDDDDTLVGADHGRRNGLVRPVPYPCDTSPRSAFLKAQRGLSVAEAAAAADGNGLNVLTIQLPKFLDLLMDQMLSPIAVFQIFTAALWMLDMYWRYTVMTLFSIVLVESGTVYQRQRTLKTLRGMAPKPYALYVFRGGTWVLLTTEGVVPGDLVSLQPKHSKAGGAPTDAVPCDCLLLRGTAVTNEATLTGESVPQMKDAIKAQPGDDDRLDMEGRDRVHTLFSGTSLITVGSGEGERGSPCAGVPVPPDGGCVCLALRTGFGSSQGKLVQLIEFSTQAVAADSKETGMALLVLLAFALVAAGYVLKKGLEKGDRTTHELLIKCVIILTSVVPRQLPVQMALAVNQALMNLHKTAGVMCTEPFRVPSAGKVTHCLFDKTGTLTTDQMVPLGVLGVRSAGDRPAGLEALLGEDGDGGNSGLDAFDRATPEVSMVLAGCHSLVSLGDLMGLNADGAADEGAGTKQGLVGDSIELSALKALGWRYESSRNTASPGDWEASEKAAAKCAAELEKPDFVDPVARQAMAGRMEGLVRKIEVAKRFGKDSSVQSVQILARHHFESSLQRMSTVAKVARKGSGVSVACLVKGSAEALKPLILEDELPTWYDEAHTRMAEKGMRVLALAFKYVSDDDAQGAATSWDRAQVECGLTFAGFVAFQCRVRADSPVVISALTESAHRCVMVTGDAPLTALYVARECGICRKDAKALILREDGRAWVGVGGGHDRVVPYKPGEAKGLAESGYALAATEKALEACHAFSEGKIWSEVSHLCVFARMRPRGKARVIRAIQRHSGGKAQVLMCGDGGNDVGALKQADVGLALLNGFGDKNTDAEALQAKNVAVAEGAGAEEALNLQARVIKAKSADNGARINALMKAKQQELSKLVAGQWLMEELEARRARGESHEGMGAQFAAMKVTAGRLKQELHLYRSELARIHGDVYTDTGSAASLASAAEAVEEAGAGGGPPMVRPGDASVAAPFTSRSPSIKAVVDLIRQGRCTLLGALQQQQIMMLESMISAYTLSAMSLEGGRSSERQMMASSWLIMTASVAFSYSKPVEKMHRERPPRSLFHPSIFLSTLGQAAIHLVTMVYCVKWATDAMGPAALAEVKDFNRRLRLGEEARVLQAELDGVDPDTLGDPGEVDYLQQFMLMWNAPFMPNLLNSSVFLVETAQIIAVLFVNYKGRPWMSGLMENRALFISVFLTIVLVAVCAWELIPAGNALIHLHPFPSDDYRIKVVSAVLLSIFGTFFWDRLMALIFAPAVFKAMASEFLALKLSDFVAVFELVIKVAAGLLLLLSGNLLFMAGAWWYYRKWTAEKNKREARELLGTGPMQAPAIARNS